MRKSLPIGVSNYEELRVKDYYVVDKTMMIEDFLTRKYKVTLITRPRRFGKTSNMSMMSEFFDINKKSEKVFKNTKIAETEYYKEMNQYPVIFLSFANCKGDINSLKKAILEVLRLEYTNYRFLFENEQNDNLYRDEVIKNYKALIETRSLSDVNSCIKILSLFLKCHYKKKVMIFIDEYDTPFIEAHVQGYYDDIKSDLALLLQSALKDNDALEYAMLTGIQRVSKENIFSHLNNILVCTVRDKEYASYFGFTTEETQELLVYYGLELNDRVKAMYDGYNMGGVDIYNPWSIINYALKKELISYWVNTSSNTMMKDAMKNSDISFQNDYEKLIQEGSLNVQTNLSTSFYEVQDNSNLWGLFVNAGYLTIAETLDVEDEIYKLRIPNREVLREFKSLTASYLQVSTMELKNLYDGLKTRNQEQFLIAYRFLLKANPSYHDLKSENSYHMLMLGICLYLNPEYEIISNREVGTGRCDIILQAKRKDLPSYIIEFRYCAPSVKYSKTETNLTDLANQAIDQIKARQYDFNLEGEVIYVGLAHHGKDVEMKWEVQ